jgi:hypothetical protein
LPLTWPIDAGHTLVKLRATARLLIQVKSETLDVDFSASPNTQIKTIAGLKCTVPPFQSQGSQQGNAQITISRGQQSNAEWRQLCAGIGGIMPKLLDSRGNAARQVQSSGFNASDAQITANFYWFNQSNGDPDTAAKMTRLTLAIPTEMKMVQVPIEFDDLPLP